MRGLRVSILDARAIKREALRLHRVFGPMAVLQNCSADPDQIGFVLLQKQVCRFRIGNAARQDHGDGNMVFDGF